MITSPIERKKHRVRIRMRQRANSYPRLSVHRSCKFIYAQVIDDSVGFTIASASDIKLKAEKKTKIQRAVLVGSEIAGKLKKLNVKQLVFDKGPYKYTGRIAALADAVRHGGITI